MKYSPKSPNDLLDIITYLLSLFKCQYFHKCGMLECYTWEITLSISHHFLKWVLWSVCWITNMSPKIKSTILSLLLEMEKMKKVYPRRIQDSMVPGCYGVLNDEISQKQADFTVFVLDPRGACTPFAPPGYACVYSLLLSKVRIVHWQWICTMSSKNSFCVKLC